MKKPKSTPQHMLLRLMCLAELLECKTAVHSDSTQDSPSCEKTENKKDNQEKQKEIVQLHKNVVG